MNEDGAEFWYMFQQGYSGSMFASPANRDLDEACDAQATDLDIAICVDRIETYTNFKVDKILSKWAGLRCYSTDGNPIHGKDNYDDTFIWVAGLAGQGIQSCPGYSQLVANIILYDQNENDIHSNKYNIKHIDNLLQLGFDYNDINPKRFSHDLKSIV